MLKDLFPDDAKALEEAKQWMKERNNPSLVAGHLALLSEAVEAQVKSMQKPMQPPTDFYDMARVGRALEGPGAHSQQPSG